MLGIKFRLLSIQFSHSVMSDSLWPHGLYSPWNSPGQNTGVGSLFLLHGIFPAQGLNPGLPCCRQILYQLSHKGSLRILRVGSLLFSSISFWPRNQTGVSCIAGGFFTNWAICEAQEERHLYPHGINNLLEGCNEINGALRWGEMRWSRSVVSDSLRPHGL